MFPYFLLFIFTCSAIIQIGYWVFVFARLAFYDTSVAHQESSSFIVHRSSFPVSVVICAHNEEKNIADCLPFVLEQDYPVFEVVVVNDASSDATLEILNRFQKKYAHLHIMNIRDKKTGGKKAALAEGIKAAQYEALLLTDADCVPASQNWINEMAAQLSNPETEIVLGYAPHKKYVGSFINIFVCCETVWTAMQYFGFALAGFPYMGVGRNMMYRKRNFEKNKIFFSKNKLISGDDDLLVNNFITKNNFSICISNDSFMWSEPQKNWKNFFRQKKRHLSTGTHYKFIHQFLLGLLSVSHFLFFVTAIGMILLKFSTIFVIIIYVIRLLVTGAMCRRIFNKFSENRLLYCLPILDFAFVIYCVVMVPSLFFKTQNWK